MRAILVKLAGAPTPEPSALIPVRAERPDWRRIGVSAFVLVAGVVIVWLPVAGLVSAAVRGGVGQGAGSGPAPASIAAFQALVRDPLMRRFAVNSVFVGLAVLVLNLMLARVSAALVSLRGGAFASLARWAEAVPPLAIGVGALALPSVLAMGADGLATVFGTRSMPELALRAVVDFLDPDRTPWVLLVLAVGVARLPILARSAVAYRKGVRPVLLDAALTLGATPGRARARLTGWWLGISPGAAILTFTLAATNLTPALVHCPTADVRTVGPAVLILADEPGGGRSRAAALATVAIAANLLALAAAARERPGAIGEGFHA